MHVHHSVLQADAAVERLPAFTLATALMWLGHECRGACPRQVRDERASAWLIRSPESGWPGGVTSLVDVEFTDPTWLAARDLDLMCEINECTCTDHIVVRDATALSAFHPLCGGYCATTFESHARAPVIGGRS